MQKRTLSKWVELGGIGVHTGAEAQVVLRPAEADQGIQLRRVDKPNGHMQLIPKAVVNTTLCTKIANDSGITLQTIEHLFAAIHGMGIDALTIEVDGPEIPILDGSALPWVNLIEKGVPIELDAPRTYFEVPNATLSFGEQEARVTRDTSQLEISISSRFPAPGLEQLEGSWTITPEIFKTEIAPARTFCLMRDVERLREAGLIQGGSLDCAVVFEDDGTVLNPEGLRLPYEPLRHKILDAVGDLFLTGKPVRGRFFIPQPGHGVNNQLLRALVK